MPPTIPIFSSSVIWLRIESTRFSTSVFDGVVCAMPGSATKIRTTAIKKLCRFNPAFIRTPFLSDSRILFLELAHLIQLFVFGPGLLQDRDVGVGIFPDGEEILVRSAGRAHISGKSACPRQPEVGQSAERKIHDHPRMVNDLLKFCCSLASLASSQISLSTKIS